MINLTGASGRHYQFQFGDVSLPWTTNPAVYVFAYHSFFLPRPFIAYVGETDNMHARPMPPKHERWYEAVLQHNANAVFAMVVDGTTEMRQQIERDLIAAYNPPLNVKHRSLADEAAPVGFGMFGRGPLR
jgi:hypothetical protein